MTTQTTPFKEDLARLGRGAGPVALSRWVALARRAVASSGAEPADVEDLVQDLLAILLELPTRRPETWAKLLGAEEAKLKGWLAGRVRWLWLGRLPDAPERKALRGMIRAAQKGGLPQAGAAPDTLHKGDRLSKALVGRAVAWAIATRAAQADRLDELVSLLWARWGNELMPVEPPAPIDGERLARRGLDAFGLAKVALTRIAPSDLEILGLYASGLDYDEIARAVGCAKSTVSRRIYGAIKFLSGRRRVSRATRGLAFEYVLAACRKRLE